MEVEKIKIMLCHGFNMDLLVQNSLASKNICRLIYTKEIKVVLFYTKETRNISFVH